MTVKQILISPARKVQRNITRPTSVVVLEVLFELFKLIFPNSISIDESNTIYKILLALAGTGLIDKAIMNWKVIKEFFKSIFTKKKS
jgi:hypothetical protein